jgi:hypothetical protein
MTLTASQSGNKFRAIPAWRVPISLCGAADGGGYHGSPALRLTTEIVLVAHVFHPVDRPSVEHFGNGNVRHCARWCRAVPVTMAGGAPDDVARSNFDLRLALALGPANPVCYDQSLPERMRVPCGPCAWLERDDCPAGAGRFVTLKG